jgi:aspartyl-tRNA(Asn)/glutamyl-tRNA(Gln) amidotransferase subunit B
VASQSRNPKAIANWVINNLRARMTESQTGLGDLKFSPEHLRELVTLVDSGKISSRIAQEVFADVFATGESPGAVVQRKGLVQLSDTGALEAFCEQAIAANAGPVADYRAGKAAALNFLKGQVMKLSKGKANPALVGEILERKLQG